LKWRTGILVVAALLVASAALVKRLAAERPAAVTVDYPLEGSVFPPDITAPTFLWRDTNPDAAEWRIVIEFVDRSAPIRVQSRGPLMRVGEIDPRAVGDSNKLPELTPQQAAAHTWQPDPSTWADIKKRSTAGATVTISDRASSGLVHIQTSKDPVGAPIFYRDVPLMPSETEKGVIKPLSANAVPLIAWRLRSIANTQSRVVLTGMRTCANCHSFSLDGKTLGMDLDGPKNDKGLYALASVKPRMSIRTQDMISWKPPYEEETARDRVGFMSQVSPEGKYVLTRLSGPGSTVSSTYYVTNFNDYRFLQVFYPTRGIMVWYERATGKAQPLAGADDPRYAQTDGVWSPDSRTVVFARAEAKDPYAPGVPMAAFANDPNETQIRYDLYRVPFNGGRGGTAEPIAGASRNGMSNTFPKVSPDGRWIVFVQCRNGQLMRPDSQLYIVPVSGGVARRMRCNTSLMNSWHSFSPNGRWLVFSSKSRSPYTQMYLTHIDEDGNDSPAILIDNATAANRAVNIPEFVNIPPDMPMKIDVPAVDFYTQFDVAFALSEKHDYAAAIPEWQKAIELDPQDARSHVNLAIALVETGHADAGIVHYQKAAEIEPGNPGVFSRMATALVAMGKPEQAVPVFEKAVQLQPRDPRLPGGLGLALVQSGRTAEAIPWFRKALELNPKDAGTESNLAIALQSTGRADEAVTHMQRAAELAPEESGYQSNLGAALAQQGRVDDAIAHFRKALEMRPGDVATHLNLAMALATTGKVDEAIGHLDQAARLAPDDAGIQTNLGAALAMQGRVSEAIPHLEKALQVAPGSAEAHYHMGVADSMQGRVADAVAEWRKAIGFQPDNVLALNRLAQVLASSSQASLRNGPEAVELAERAVRLAGGEEPALLDTLAAAYAEAGRFPEAVETAHRALDAATAHNDRRLAEEVRARIALYEARAPFRVN
jgi:tetratricopeptide (TPR) repeat protein